MQSRVLKLEAVDIAHNSLHLRFAIDDLRFATAYWYEGVDFPALAERFGREQVDRIAFHIAAFEINKLASLRPDRIDFGTYGRFVTPSFAELWQTVFHNVWAEWRYKNDLPDYPGPEFADRPGPDGSEPPVRPETGEIPLLHFCGGGKDSLIAMKLLERASVAHDSLAYAASVYGDMQQQFDLIAGLQAHGAQKRVLRQWVLDDFLTSPVLDLRPDFGVATLTAAETPSSIFAALPLVLSRGYSHIALGHERSADTGQLRWSKTGEDINHQWGKSAAAEGLINAYISRYLIEGFSYFSLLKPIYDTLIFALLRRDLAAVPAAHSCNIAKPWCRRCAKCLYVWLGYSAFLPRETVIAAFGPENLLEVPENAGLFRQLLGLEDQLPFECIGQAGESQLFFALCRLKGMTGPAMESFSSAFPDLDLDGLLDRYLTIDWEGTALPADMAAPLTALWTAAIDEARRYVAGLERDVAAGAGPGYSVGRS